MEIMHKKVSRVARTAIRDILELVKKRLLVVPLARSTTSSGQSSSSLAAPTGGRATANELEVELREILERINKDERYAWASYGTRDSGGLHPKHHGPFEMILQSSRFVPVVKSQETSPSTSLESSPPLRDPVSPFPLDRHPKVLTKHIDSRRAADSGRRSLEKFGQEPASPRDLTRAIKSRNRDQARWLLEWFFGQVAVQEYSWLTELVQLGFSPREITDELLEKAIQGPWIHEPFEKPISAPSVPHFHQDNCVHGDSQTEGAIYVGRPADFVDSVRMSPHGINIIASDPVDDLRSEEIPQSGIQEIRDMTKSPSMPISNSDRVGLSARQRIEYFCGLGGVQPAADGSKNIELGSVSFKENNSRASIALNDPEDDTAVLKVLNSLDRAAGELQRLGGCCDSFTVLLNATFSGYVALQKVPFWTIRKLREIVLDPERTDHHSSLYPIFRNLFGTTDFMSGSSDDAGSLPHWVVLATQFLALGLLSYAQAHCGPIQPFFLDTPLRAISLLGSRKSPAGTFLMLSCHLVELTCMGAMVGEPVLAFDCPAAPAVDTRSVMQSPAAPRKHMLASPVDILDTWGPGYMVASANDANVLYSVSVGGGTITSSGNSTTPQLHWSKEVSGDGTTPASTFPRDEKSFIGATIVENTACQSAATRLEECIFLLEEIGTFPSYWEVMERQLGLGFQGGQTAVAIFQFNQTWVKMPGVTKKSAMLSQRAVSKSDLDGMFGVQVSICTGIARRVRLRDLLADILPAYVANLLVKPRLWEELIGSRALTALRGLDMDPWFGSLDRPSRVEFEGLVFAVLYLLRDTGIDRKGDNFVVACVQSGLPFQCFRIPCKNENSWARMLEDTKDNATFAYVTTQCLETATLKCCRPSPSWSNSTALMGTAVLEDTVASENATTAASGLVKLALRENEAYLIGQTDKKLYVQVRRPAGLDPHLLVSPSAIPPDFLQRLLRRGKLKRLREKKYSESCTESVVICAQNKYL